MKISRVFAILSKDIVYGPKSFFFIQALVTPVITSLIISLLFGSFLSGKPAVGIVYEGDSVLREMTEDVGYIRFKEHRSLDDMKDAVTAGRLDIGILIPENFDIDVRSNNPTYIKSFVWGESLLKDRAVIFAGLSDLFAGLTGREPLVDIKSVTVGGEESLPLKQRFLPLLVLLATIMSGLIIPGSTLVLEKQRQTLTALRVTPVSFAEVILAKCLLGFLMSMFSGALILLLNGSLGSNPGALILTLAMAAAFASTFGGLAGILVNNVNGFMTVMKSLMMIVYAPGILSLFPKIPEWIPKVFPTYYIFYPVVEVSQNAAGIGQVGFELLILFMLILAMVTIIFRVGKLKKVQMA